MTEKIIVEFDVEDNGTPKVAKFNDELGDTKQAAENASSGTQKASLSLTDLYSATQLAERGLSVLRDVFNETVGVTVNYANEVRQMRDVTGQTAEESSRLLQVLDDYKVSADQAGQATKKLASKDMELNIQTLARLSDQYIALGSDVERTKFLYDNFGKSGSNFAEIMKQGGDAILKANDAISKNLVLTDQQLQKAREYEKQVDNLSDAWLGFKVAAGNEALPYVTNALDSFNKKVEDTSLAWAAFSFGFDDIAKIFIDTNKDMELSVERVDKGERDNITTVEDLSDANSDLALSAEEITKANKDYLSTIGQVTKEIDSYKEKESDLQSQHSELLDEKQKLLDQGWWAESDAVQAVNDKLKENEDAQAANAEAFDLATKTRMLSMLQEQLAVDGLDQKESDFLLKQGVKWGIYSQEAVDAMAAVQRQVDAMERNIDININVHTNYSEAGQAALTTQLAGEKGYVPPKRQNAKGGTYMIPMSWGNENFPIGNSDTASGGELISITPKGQNQNKDIVDAIYATRINIDDLTRAFVLASQQVTK